jgi:tetratricopeptide (TPR) repeat protein
MNRGGRRWPGAALALSAVGAGLFFALAHYRSWRAIDAVRQSLYRSDPDELISTVARLREDRPDDAELTYMLAVAHRRAAKTTLARQLLKTAQALGWPRKDIQRQQYLIRLQSGEIKETEEYLLALTAGAYPDNEATEIYECVAKSYLANMQIAETNACLDYWLHWQPDAVQPRVIKAELLSALHDFSGEIREYQGILQLDPENFKVRSRLGQSLLSANDLAGAREQFEACSQLRTDSGLVSLGLAICCRRTGEVAKAESLLQKALEGSLTRGEEALARFELGQLALGKKDSQRAIECFQRAMELTPNSPRLNYAYGVALTRVGKKEQGNSYLEKSKAFDEQGQRFSELLDDIMRQPGSADLRCEAGKVALGMSNRTEAYRWFSSALHCDPDHKPSHKAMAEYYSQAGQKDLAQRHLALAAIDPSSAPSTVED